MKRILLLFSFAMGAFCLYSQAPESITYHAVVSDGTGHPVISQTVAFRFSIIRGGALGSLVYQERNVVETDLSGSVTLAIGNGTNVVGNFSTIEWGSDSHFLKIELDPIGGTFYTDMGTTQMLSVPYALYAKTASNGFSGDYNDLTSKPITDGSETKILAGNKIILSGNGTSSNPYTITNGFTGDYADLANKPITDGSETKISAGDNIEVSGDGTISSPYVIINGFSGNYNDLKNIPVTDGSETHVLVGNNLTITGSGTLASPYLIDSKVHTIGEAYGGGIIFYVYDNGQHGLIASMSDQDPEIKWDNGTKRYTNTTGDGVGSGEMNTALIIGLQTNDNQTGNFAAKVCADYSVIKDGIQYGDWYLPSKHELNLIFMQKSVIGGLSSNYYWSSTEFSSISAWAQNFSNGYQYNLGKSSPYSIRAIRSF